MSHPLVSIIVPVFNTPFKLLQRCALSLLRQTYKNIEIIIVDDGSVEKCAEYCDEIGVLDKRIVVIHQDNGGVSSARNMGIERMDGQYCMFVDPDDELCAEKCIEEAVNAALKTSADMVVGRISYQFRDKCFDNLNHLPRKENIYRGKQVVNNLADYYIAFYPPKSSLIPADLNRGPVSKLFSRKAIGDIRFDTKLDYAEDAVFCSEVCRSAECIVLLDSVWYRYFQYKSSISHSKGFSICRRHCENGAAHLTDEMQKSLSVPFSTHCIINTCVTNVQSRGFRSYKELRAFISEDWVKDCLRQFDDTQFSMSWWERGLRALIVAGMTPLLFIMLQFGVAVLKIKGKLPIEFSQ